MRVDYDFLINSLTGAGIFRMDKKQLVKSRSAGITVPSKYFHFSNGSEQVQYGEKLKIIKL